MNKLLNRKNQKRLRQKLRNHPPLAEKILWKELKNKKLKGYKFRRQQGIGKYVIDFYCPNASLIIELDGESHYQDKKASFKDKVRDNFLSNNGFQVIRFNNNEIYKNLEGVLEEISNKLMKTTPDPSL